MDKYLKTPTTQSFPRTRGQTVSQSACQTVRQPYYHAKQPKGLVAGAQRQSITNNTPIFRKRKKGSLIISQIVGFNQPIKPC